MPKNAAPIILSLAYILGLLATAVPWGGVGVLILGGIAAIALPRFWKGKLSPTIWIAAGLVGLVASLYFQIRLPQPGAFDISRLVPTIAEKQTVTASGIITETPRLTRSGNAQLWLDVNRVDGANSKIAPDRFRGNLYATVPLLQATGLHPGQTIALTGSLYKPKPATNPGGFDFEAYLAQSGCFAGLKGQSLEVVKAGNPWGWWVIRQKILRSQIAWLGSPEGQLVSAMVLGGRVVDLPFDVKDQFIRIGLCHALAASGFQVSLILGVVLELTKRFSERIQVGCGAFALLIFLGLTGLQPAVLRAVIMGGGLLIGLATKRRVKPLSGLLFAAMILVLANPIWIWDLGFQLSFLATMGLQITVSPLVKRLDWLPTMIATLIAIPIAAYIWTLPLLLYVFGVVSPYSILANIIVTPLISIISIGGMISALLALASPIAGTVSAWLLHYPTFWLLTIVDFFCQLPGNAIAVGTISAFSLIVLYSLIGLPWLRPQFQRHLWVIELAAIALVFVPASYAKATLFQATVLATSQDPILVIQDRGKVALVSSGDEATVRSTLLPFLQKEGINAIDWAISTPSTRRSNSGWTTLLDQMPVRSFYQTAPNSQLTDAIAAQKGRYLPLSVGQRINLQSTSVQPISRNPDILQLQVGDQQWLWLKDSLKNQQVASDGLQRHSVLWWSGQAIESDWVEKLHPKVAIAYSHQVDQETVDRLQTHQTRVYQTRQDGAIRWTGKRFEQTLGIRETDASPL
ncbi:ComEC/Rec2 family competence protein [Phormidesmis sp. 146-33]